MATRTSAFDADVLIAGASFAGLAVARELRGAGRVVIMDPGDIGAGQTSACGTTLDVVQRLGVAGLSQQQVADRLVVHIGGRTLSYPLPYAYCTFDYQRLCTALFQQSDATFQRARVRGIADGPALATQPPGQPEGVTVRTTQGTLRARFVVDATGWRAALAQSVHPQFVSPATLSGGVEVELPYQEDGLHFWAGSDIIQGGYAWVFPCGATARIGILAYGRTGRLKDDLARFFTRLGLRADPSWPYHGGRLPFAPRSPVAGPVFVTGDAAGLCFGLTGEGIRPAITFSARCGQLLRQALTGQRTAPNAARAYTRYCRLRQPYFRLLTWLQSRVGRWPDSTLLAYARLARPWPLFPFLMGEYRRAAHPSSSLG